MNAAPGEVRFHLGTHHPHWLSHAGVDLFVSDARLAGYKMLPVAAASWALDSRGFSMLQQHGQWKVTATDYAARVRRYRDEIGKLAWASPQDWMVDPMVIYGGQSGPLRFAGTRNVLDPAGRLSFDELVFEHQRLTVLNRLRLRDLDPTLPIIEVVQGWEPWHYVRMVDLYWELAGIDLTQAPLVGVGSIARRQDTHEPGEIFKALHDRGVTRVHAYGFKILGLRRHRRWVLSADSMTWSYGAMRAGRAAVRQGRSGLMPGCVPGPHHPAKTCANCLPYALRWRDDVIAAAHGRPPRFRAMSEFADQLALWDVEPGGAA